MDSSERYLHAAVAASAVVIRDYSTSFSLAARMMPCRVRDHITSIYGLVRVADEIVEGYDHSSREDVEPLVAKARELLAES